MDVWGVLQVVRSALARAAGGRRAGVTAPPGPVAAAPADPFRTLALQYRLGALARELDGLAVDDGRVFARGVRLTAVSAAYDDVLADACRLAGIPLQRDGRSRREVRRLTAETALRSAGWTW